VKPPTPAKTLRGLGIFLTEAPPTSSLKHLFHALFPRPPVFAAYFAETTKVKKASTGRPVRLNGCFRSLPQK